MQKLSKLSKQEILTLLAPSFGLALAITSFVFNPLYSGHYHSVLVLNSFFVAVLLNCTTIVFFFLLIIFTPKQKKKAKITVIEPNEPEHVNNQKRYESDGKILDYNGFGPPKEVATSK